MTANAVDQLLVEDLRALLSAERQINNALAKPTKAASSQYSSPTAKEAA